MVLALTLLRRFVYGAAIAVSLLSPCSIVQAQTQDTQRFVVGEASFALAKLDAAPSRTTHHDRCCCGTNGSWISTRERPLAFATSTRRQVDQGLGLTSSLTAAESCRHSRAAYARHDLPTNSRLFAVLRRYRI